MYRFETIAPNKLNEIKGVIDVTDEGFLTLETNYGEEYYDFKDTLDCLHIEDYDVLPDKLDFYLNRNYLLIKGIAFFKELDESSGITYLSLLDKRQPKYRARFKYCEDTNKFLLTESTFEAERRLEMLQIVESDSKLKNL